MKRLNQLEFGIAVKLLLTVLVIGVAATGWMAWQAQDKKDATDSSNQKEVTDFNHDQTKETVISNGMFTGVAPKTGSGTVSIVKNPDNSHTVRLEDDFVVQKGPDLFIGFGNDGDLDMDTLFVELKTYEGRQEFAVPTTIDISKYNQVIVYCKQFKALFAIATLE